MKQRALEVGDVMLETGVGRHADGSFWWAAVGPVLEGDLKLPRGHVANADGVLLVGPFTTAAKAAADLKKFEVELMRQIDCTVEAAPPREKMS
jgi:hypothetical protein